MTKPTLSQAYRAALQARPDAVDAELLDRVTGAVGSRAQRDEDLSTALADPAFVAALRIGMALRADAESLSTEMRALRAPQRSPAARRSLPYGWAVAASVALAALTGLAMQPMQPGSQVPVLAEDSLQASADLISSVSFEKDERGPRSSANEGAIFVDRFDS